MEKVYARFKDRKAYRWKVFGVCVVLAIIATLIGVYTYINFRWLSDYLSATIIFVFAFIMTYIISRPWFTETLETRIFVVMYEAFKHLEMCSDDVETSHFYSEKAAKKVKRAISILRGFKSKLGETNSSLVNKSFEPFKTLTQNLETRILPKVLAQKDVSTMTSVLRGLAQLFGDINRQISLEDITEKNKNLERFEQMPDEEKPSKIGKILSTETIESLSNEPIKFSGSIVLGIGIIFFIAFGHSIWFKYDLVKPLSDLMTFLGVIGVGIAIGIGIYGIGKVK